MSCLKSEIWSWVLQGVWSSHTFGCFGTFLSLWQCWKSILVSWLPQEVLWSCCNVQGVFTLTPLLLPCFYWQKIILTTESGLEEEEFIDRTLPLETNNNLVSSPEKAQSPPWSVTEVTPSSGTAPDCPVDPRVRDHTNNRIGESCFLLFPFAIFFFQIIKHGTDCHSKIISKLQCPDLWHKNAYSYEYNAFFFSSLSYEFDRKFPSSSFSFWNM